MELIISQRLLRKPCRHFLTCKTAKTLDAGLFLLPFTLNIAGGVIEHLLNNAFKLIITKKNNKECVVSRC